MVLQDPRALDQGSCPSSITDLGPCVPPLWAYSPICDLQALMFSVDPPPARPRGYPQPIPVSRGVSLTPQQTKDKHQAPLPAIQGLPQTQEGIFLTNTAPHPHATASALATVS